MRQKLGPQSRRGGCSSIGVGGVSSMAYVMLETVKAKGPTERKGEEQRGGGNVMGECERDEVEEWLNEVHMHVCMYKCERDTDTEQHLR